MVGSDQHCFCWAVDLSMSEVIRDREDADVVGCETAYRQDAPRMIRFQVSANGKPEAADGFVLLLASEGKRLLIDRDG